MVLSALGKAVMMVDATQVKLGVQGFNFSWIAAESSDSRDLCIFFLDGIPSAPLHALTGFLAASALFAVWPFVSFCSPFVTFLIPFVYLRDYLPWDSLKVVMEAVQRSLGGWDPRQAAGHALLGDVHSIRTGDAGPATWIELISKNMPGFLTLIWRLKMVTRWQCPWIGERWGKPFQTNPDNHDSTLERIYARSCWWLLKDGSIDTGCCTPGLDAVHRQSPFCVKPPTKTCERLPNLSEVGLSTGDLQETHGTQKFVPELG